MDIWMLLVFLGGGVALFRLVLQWLDDMRARAEAREWMARLLERKAEERARERRQRYAPLYGSQGAAEVVAGPGSQPARSYDDWLRENNIGLPLVLDSVPAGAWQEGGDSGDEHREAQA